LAPLNGNVQFHALEVTIMTWEAPDFVEVRMDAEINSYQDDFGGEQDDRF
jgi:coenzyme PQQ precursor peptide PqqA